MSHRRHRRPRRRREHAHLHRVESAVASRRCPECGCGWNRVRRAGRPGMLSVTCLSGHVSVAFIAGDGRVHVDLVPERQAEARA